MLVAVELVDCRYKLSDAVMCRGAWKVNKPGRGPPDNGSLTLADRKLLWLVDGRCAGGPTVWLIMEPSQGSLIG
jgi:hypothetical protein